MRRRSWCAAASSGPRRPDGCAPTASNRTPWARPSGGSANAVRAGNADSTGSAIVSPSWARSRGDERALRHARQLLHRAGLRRLPRAGVRGVGRSPGQGALVRRPGGMGPRGPRARLPRRGPRAKHRRAGGRPGPRYTAVYWDIVENERIVNTYEMALDGTRISVSLTTVELRPDGAGTRLRLTEHGAHLDGHAPVAERAEGVGSPAGHSARHCRALARRARRCRSRRARRAGARIERSRRPARPRTTGSRRLHRRARAARRRGGQGRRRQRLEVTGRDHDDGRARPRQRGRPRQPARGPASARDFHQALRERLPDGLLATL